MTKRDSDHRNPALIGPNAPPENRMRSRPRRLQRVSVSRSSSSFSVLFLVSGQTQFIIEAILEIRTTHPETAPSA